MGTISNQGDLKSDLVCTRSHLYFSKLSCIALCCFLALQIYCLAIYYFKLAITASTLCELKDKIREI